ncbi:MAG: iron complex outerrane recepter protein [Sphingomonadales bacterium]|nr:iron complex outerrane recepter protein [Sphingomonadales bacterium]
MKISCATSAMAMAAGAFAAPAFAQDNPAAATRAAVRAEAPAAARADAKPDGDIVVTARRREETSIAIPVAVTALDRNMIDRQNITSLADIAKLVPGLKVGEVSGGVGGTIVLRGVGTTAGSNASFEQTVSTNIDGVQLSRGNALRLGQIDMQTIEILKGPQALFFGKNSPAGVISIRSADPGDALEIIGRVGYEFNAQEMRGDFVVSSPLTETLGVRLALSASTMDGFRTNLAGQAMAAANAIRPGTVTGYVRRGPEQEFYFGRGTVKWKPSSAFDARGKFTYAKVSGIGYQQGGGFQRIYCPNGGVPFQNNQATAANGGVANPALAAALAVDDCKANNLFANGQLNPAFLAQAPFADRDPRGKGDYLQMIGSWEMNYRLRDHLKLTSVTGYVKQKEFRYDTYSNSPSDAVAALDFYGYTRYRQVSEEIRLTSSMPGPVNFLLGGYYDKTRLATNTTLIVNGPIFNQQIEGRALSGFGQLLWNLVPTLELAGGARYTSEDRDIVVTRNGIVQPLLINHARFNNLSPEATITYRPTGRLTFYGAYKQGFKSGGFAAPLTSGAALVAPGPNFLYKPEKVSGFEIGAKALLLDGTLRINTAAYSYKYSDLQVNSLDNSSGVAVIRVTNAAAARVKGAEGDFVLRPHGLRGFDLHGAVAYNDARYTDFLATCYIGQTVAMGCNRNPNAAGVNQGQQLAGQQLINAPRWNGSIGFNLDRNVASSGLAIGFSGDAVFKSSYNPHPERAPGAQQRGVTFLNATARVYDRDHGWEVALIGRNLTNQYRVDVASNAGQTGIAARTGTTIAGGLADLNGNVNRGRELLLQLTLRPVRP